MPLPSRRTRAIAALGVAAALGMTLAPTSNATTEPLSSVTEAAFAPQLVTVDTPTREAKALLTSLGLDLTEHAGHDYVEVVLHSAADEALLRDAGFTWDVRIADMLARQLERIELDEAYAAANARSSLPSGNNGYRVLESFGREIDELVALNGDIAKRISIGESVEGRDLTGIEIGEGVNEPEDGRPVFLMFGAHHAREWPSAELPMEFAHDLVKGYTDPAHPQHARVKDLLSRGRAIIVPVSNPDGYDASRTSGELIDFRDETYDPVTSEGDAALGLEGGTAILGTPGNAYKRKNCRYLPGQEHPAGSCVLLPSNGGLGVGIDLNRNYGALWGGPGASGDSTAATYRGPAPFSEPETQAIRNLISTRQVTTLITNHTFSNLILRPVGVQPGTLAPDGNPMGFSPDECFTTADGRDLGMQALGERMAAQNGYSNQFGWELYDTTGTTEDYSYNATGGYGYTFEIGANEFHPPFSEVVAEYVGETPAAQGVKPETAEDLTTDAADECGGDAHDHEKVGGGNREAFFVAFENAVDPATHSVITGVAPAGSTVTVERTGVFPLWDGSFVADTVATAMLVDGDGAFEYHTNPSTRPFVQSRKAPVLGPEKDSLDAPGATPPQSSTEETFDVTEPADLLRATVRTAFPIDGQVVNYAQFHLALIDPDGNVVAEAKEFGPVNSIVWTGPDGNGVPAGAYTLRVTNNIAATSNYELEALTQDVVGDETPRQFEQWTVSCLTAAGELAGQMGVSVERGQSVDIGDLCGAGLGTGETPKPKKPKKNPR